MNSTISPRKEQKARALYLLKVALGLAAGGTAYLLLWKGLGISLHCPLRFFTGLYCPGCGVSRMLFALLQFDFPAAFHSNMLLMILLPVLAAEAAITLLRYVRTGSAVLTKRQNVLVWILIVLLVIYGILRNIPLFYWMHPQ